MITRGYALSLTVGDYLTVTFFGLGLAAFLLLALSIQRQLAQLLRLSKDTLMDEQTLQTTMDEIKALVGDVATRMTGQANQIAVLQEQQASGVPVTQEQLNGLGNEATAIKNMLAALTGQPAVPAAPAEPPAAEVPPATEPATEPATTSEPPAASSPDAGSTPGGTPV